MINLIYVVIDTNVFVSALITKNKDSATVKVLEAVLCGDVVPLYNKEILNEYEEVLSRSKFKLSTRVINVMLLAIEKYGIEVFPQSTGEILVDMDDLVFFEVVMEKRSDDAYLVTGNQKHFPIRDFIVTPADMMKIINKHKKDSL